MGVADIFASIFGNLLAPFEPRPPREKYSWELDDDNAYIDGFANNIQHTFTGNETMENNQLTELEEIMIGVSSLAEVMTQNNAILRNMMGNQFRILQKLEEMTDEQVGQLANENYENIRALMADNVTAYNQIVAQKVQQKLEQKSAAAQAE